MLLKQNSKTEEYVRLQTEWCIKLNIRNGDLVRVIARGDEASGWTYGWDEEAEAVLGKVCRIRDYQYLGAGLFVSNEKPEFGLRVCVIDTDTMEDLDHGAIVPFYVLQKIQV